MTEQTSEKGMSDKEKLAFVTKELKRVIQESPLPEQSDKIIAALAHAQDYSPTSEEEFMAAFVVAVLENSGLSREEIAEELKGFKPEEPQESS